MAKAPKEIHVRLVVDIAPLVGLDALDGLLRAAREAAWNEGHESHTAAPNPYAPEAS